MMRLLFFLENGRRVGGGDYAIFKIAQYLSRRHKITIFAKSRPEFYSSLPQHIDFHIRGSFPRFKGSGMLNRIWEKIYDFFVLYPFIKKKRPDYVIGYLRDAAIKSTRLGKRYGIKNVNFIFESPPLMERDLGRRWKKEYTGKFYNSWQKAKQAYLDSDILLAISRLTLREARSWLKRDVQAYIYPGIDKKRKTSNTKKEDQIIYVGRINPYKNVDLLLRALAKIRSPPRLVIIGEGEDSSKIRSLAKRLRLDVRFLGTVDDNTKFKEIEKSLLMVFPSSHEGFGMPPMEALICGVPCLCSNKEIFREVYGTNVEYFAQYDIDDLVRVLSSLLKNPEKLSRLGSVGKSYVEKKFSWDISAKKFEDILKNNLKAHDKKQKNKKTKI